QTLQGHSPFWKPRSGPPGRSHDQTVALILAGEIHYPRSIGPIAKSMIRDLLSPDPRASAGASAGGWQSVKEHAFFKDMHWEALLRGDIAAPIKPSGIGRGMVGNFAREYTRQRAAWGGDQQELRDVADKEGLFKRELMGFDFVRD
ncbi:unnamed protein product, partial [Hapterophycus canaliculatus]